MIEYCHGTNKLHLPVIIMETAEVLKEICSQCKEQAIFNKSKHGSIDNEKYRVFHKRDMLQPGDKEFNEIYKV